MEMSVIKPQPADEFIAWLVEYNKQIKMGQQALI
jgi:hypothetical protein